MKKVLVLLSLVAAVSAFSQGSVNFYTRNAGTTPAINAPIGYAAGGPVAAQKATSGLTFASGAYTYGGANVQAGLYGGAEGTPESSWVLLTPAVGFLATTGTKAGYIDSTTVDPVRNLTGVAGGASATLQVRAWDAGVTAASYEAAAALVSGTHGVYLGKSTPLHNVVLGGGGTPPAPPAELIGLAGFDMAYTIVPEPSIIGLGILGAVAGLMVFRRRE